MPADELVAHLRELTFERSLHIGHPGSWPTSAARAPSRARRPSCSPRRSTSTWAATGSAPAPTEIELHLTRWFAPRFGLPEGAGGMIDDRRRDGELRRAQVRARREARPRRPRAGRARPPAARALRFRGGARRDPPRRRHARPRRERRAPDRRSTASSGCGSTRSSAAIARDRAAGVRPIAVCATAGTRRPARSTRCPRSPRSRASTGCGSTSTPPTAAPRRSPTRCAPLSRVSSAPTRSRSTRTSGSTRRTPAGCVLVRDFGALSRSFHSDALHLLDEAARHGVDFAMHGPQFSRGFAALKVWVSLLAHGRAAYGRRIAHDVALARYLGELVEAHPDFELMCAAARSRSAASATARPAGAASEETRPHQRAADGGDPGRRPRVPLQCGDRRPLRAARLHRQLPHRGRRTSSGCSPSPPSWACPADARHWLGRPGTAIPDS